MNFKWIAAGLCLLAPALSFATVECRSTVRHLQVENYAVLVYLEGLNWHMVGRHSEAGTKEKLSVLLSAQATGKSVTIRYPAGYDCAAYEIATSSLMVRSHN